MHLSLTKTSGIYYVLFYSVRYVVLPVSTVALNRQTKHWHKGEMKGFHLVEIYKPTA